MAKHLTTEQAEEWHKEATLLYPCFPINTFLEYFNHEDGIIHTALKCETREQSNEYWLVKLTFTLLVLAAEEELDGYPMEAVHAEASNEATE